MMVCWRDGPGVSGERECEAGVRGAAGYGSEEDGHVAVRRCAYNGDTKSAEYPKLH